MTYASLAQRYPNFDIPIPDESKVPVSLRTSMGFLSRAASASSPQIPSNPKVVPPEDDNHTKTRLPTAIFTPLLVCQTIATPYLMSTSYPGLASSHDLVLIRGEFPRCCHEINYGSLAIYLLS